MVKKNMNRIWGVLFALTLAFTLTSCGNVSGGSESGVGSQTEETGVSESSNSSHAEEAGVSESSNDSQTEEPVTQEIVDMAGRSHTISANVEKVLGYNAMAQNFMFTLSPEKMSSLGNALSEGEAHFYPQEVINLPILGDNSGKNIMNLEEVIATGPDFILNVTTISDSAISKSDELQSQLNIPVVIVDADLDKLDESYRMVGELIGCEEQAEKLASYAEKVIADVNEKAGSIAEENKVSYYYAEGKDGLMTDPSGSDHTRAFDVIGAQNCVSMENYDTYFGRENVSMELIFELDPDVVIFCPAESIFTPDGTSICQDLMDGKDVGSWMILDAVKENKFYEAPYGIANAIDRPATVNLLYGCQWLGSVIYPEVFDYNMVEVTREFYSLFYHYEISDEEIETLLSRGKIR